MNYADYQKQRESYDEATREHGRVWQELTAPLDVADAQCKREWTAWDWKVEMGVRHHPMLHRGERTVSSTYELNHLEDGWRGALLFSGALYLFRMWKVGEIAELPPDGALIVAMVPHTTYAEWLRRQLEVFRALLAGS